MSKFVDLTEKRFGKLIVIERKGSAPNGDAIWKCKCDCGNIKVIRSCALTSGRTKSCGCYHKEIISNEKNVNYKHGKTKTRLYHIYYNMKDRCYKENNKRYKNYGGRGIKICEEWLNDFMNFYNWAMTNGYKEDLTIDRIDVNGNYEPSNCMWSNSFKQMNNTTRNHYIIYNNEKHTMAEWSRILKIPYDILKRKINIKKLKLEEIIKENCNE